MTISQYIRIVVSLVIAGLRIAGVTHESYQAAAHLFVGGLVAAYWTQRGTGFWDVDSKGFTNLLLAIALTVVEVACFLWFRFVQT